MFGSQKLVLFKTLKNSDRNITRQRSVTRMFLIKAASRLTRLGPRTSGRVRATFPNVKGAGCVKAVTSNHSETCCCVDRDCVMSALRPTLLGRFPPPATVVVRTSGNPL